MKKKVFENIGILECENNNSSPESISTNCEARALKLAKNGNAIDFVDNKEMAQWVEIKSEREFQFAGCFMRSKIV